MKVSFLIPRRLGLGEELCADFSSTQKNRQVLLKEGGGEEKPLFIPEKKGAGKIKKLLYG